MRHAIKCTCSHCQRETYFTAAIASRLDAISNTACQRCGRKGVVFTLNAAAPYDAVILDRIPDVDMPDMPLQSCGL